MAAPVFVRPLSDKDSRERQRVRFDCTVSGTPKPEITWFHKETPLENSPDVKIESVDSRVKGEYSHTAYLDNCTLESTGEVKAVATNKAGEATSVANLVIQVKKEMPKFLKKPEPVECMEHDEVRFVTSVSGTPEPTIEWYRGEAKLEPSDRIIYDKSDNVHTLIIKNVKKDEEGMVTVKAVNELGDMAASARLRVTAVQPPKIVKPTKDAIAPEQGTAKFSAKITGFPQPTVTWYLNDEELPESEHIIYDFTKKDNTYHLTLTGDLRGMTGKVKVIAKNNGGEASCESQLTIRGRAPTFIEKPLKCTILEDHTAVFRCRIDGDPMPTVEWSKGKWRKLVNNKTIRIFYDKETDQHVLEMDNTQSKDAGTYTVTITNEYGTDNCPATLMVTNNEEEVQDWVAALKKTEVQEKVTEEEEVDWRSRLKKGKAREMEEGEDDEAFKLKKVEVTTTEAPVPVDEVEITELERQKSEFKPTQREDIELEKQEPKAKKPVEEKVKPEDDKDKYQRKPKEKSEEPAEPFKLVIPKAEFKFVRELEDMNVVENEYAVFECEVNRKKVPVDWYINDKTVEVGPKYQIFAEDAVHRLSINMAKPEDHGEIKCIFKKKTTTAKLTVEREEPPYFTRMLDDVLVKEHETAEFIAEVHPPNALVVWFVDNEEVTEGERYNMTIDGPTRILRINEAIREDEGKITAIVGEAETYAYLEIEIEDEYEIVTDRLLFEMRQEKHMKVIGEFLCARGGVHSIELTTSDNDKKALRPVEKANQRRWVVKKIFLDNMGSVKIDKWAVKSYVDYTCSAEALDNISRGFLNDVSFSKQTVEFILELTRPNLVVKWLKDGFPIHDDDGEKYLINFEDDGTFHTLRVYDVQDSDEGVYTFKVNHRRSSVSLSLSELYSEENFERLSPSSGVFRKELEYTIEDNPLRFKPYGSMTDFSFSDSGRGRSIDSSLHLSSSLSRLSGTRSGSGSFPRVGGSTRLSGSLSEVFYEEDLATPSEPLLVHVPRSSRDHYGSMSMLPEEAQMVEKQRLLSATDASALVPRLELGDSDEDKPKKKLLFMSYSDYSEQDSSLIRLSSESESLSSSKDYLSLQYTDPHSLRSPLEAIEDVELPPNPESPRSTADSPRSAVESPRSPVESPRSAVESPRSTGESPRSAVESPRSAVESPRSAVESQRSAVESPRSAVESQRSRSTIDSLDTTHSVSTDRDTVIISSPRSTVMSINSDQVISLTFKGSAFSDSASVQRVRDSEESDTDTEKLDESCTDTPRTTSTMTEEEEDWSKYVAQAEQTIQEMDITLQGHDTSSRETLVQQQQQQALLRQHEDMQDFDLHDQIMLVQFRCHEAIVEVTEDSSEVSSVSDFKHDIELDISRSSRNYPNQTSHGESSDTDNDDVFVCNDQRDTVDDDYLHPVGLSYERNSHGYLDSTNSEVEYLQLGTDSEGDHPNSEHTDRDTGTCTPSLLSEAPEDINIVVLDTTIAEPETPGFLRESSSESIKLTGQTYAINIEEHIDGSDDYRENIEEWVKVHRDIHCNINQRFDHHIDTGQKNSTGGSDAAKSYFKHISVASVDDDDYEVLDVSNVENVDMDEEYEVLDIAKPSDKNIVDSGNISREYETLKSSDQYTKLFNTDSDQNQIEPFSPDTDSEYTIPQKVTLKENESFEKLLTNDNSSIQDDAYEKLSTNQSIEKPSIQIPGTPSLYSTNVKIIKPVSKLEHDIGLNSVSNMHTEYEKDNEKSNFIQATEITNVKLPGTTNIALTQEQPLSNIIETLDLEQPKSPTGKEKLIYSLESRIEIQSPVRRWKRYKSMAYKKVDPKQRKEQLRRCQSEKSLNVDSEVEEKPSIWRSISTYSLEREESASDLSRPVSYECISSLQYKDESDGSSDNEYLVPSRQIAAGSIHSEGESYEGIQYLDELTEDQDLDLIYQRNISILTPNHEHVDINVLGESKSVDELSYEQIIKISKAEDIGVSDYEIIEQSKLEIMGISKSSDTTNENVSSSDENHVDTSPLAKDICLTKETLAAHDKGTPAEASRDTVQRGRSRSWAESLLVVKVKDYTSDDKSDMKLYAIDKGSKTTAAKMETETTEMEESLLVVKATDHNSDDKRNLQRHTTETESTAAEMEETDCHSAAIQNIESITTDGRPVEDQRPRSWSETLLVYHIGSPEKESLSRSNILSDSAHEDTKPNESNDRSVDYSGNEKENVSDSDSTGCPDAAQNADGLKLMSVADDLSDSVQMEINQSLEDNVGYTYATASGITPEVCSSLPEVDIDSDSDGYSNASTTEVDVPSDNIEQSLEDFSCEGDQLVLTIEVEEARKLSTIDEQQTPNDSSLNLQHGAHLISSLQVMDAISESQVDYLPDSADPIHVDYHSRLSKEQSVSQVECINQESKVEISDIHFQTDQEVQDESTHAGLHQTEAEIIEQSNTLNATSSEDSSEVSSVVTELGVFACTITNEIMSNLYESVDKYEKSKDGTGILNPPVSNLRNIRQPEIFDMRSRSSSDPPHISDETLPSQETSQNIFSLDMFSEALSRDIIVKAMDPIWFVESNIDKDNHDSVMRVKDSAGLVQGSTMMQEDLATDGENSATMIEDSVPITEHSSENLHSEKADNEEEIESMELDVSEDESDKPLTEIQLSNFANRTVEDVFQGVFMYLCEYMYDHNDPKFQRQVDNIVNDSIQQAVDIYEAELLANIQVQNESVQSISNGETDVAKSTSVENSLTQLHDRMICESSEMTPPVRIEEIYDNSVIETIDNDSMDDHMEHNPEMDMNNTAQNPMVVICEDEFHEQSRIIVEEVMRKAQQNWEILTNDIAGNSSPTVITSDGDKHKMKHFSLDSISEEEEPKEIVKQVVIPYLGNIPKIIVTDYSDNIWKNIPQIVVSDYSDNVWRDIPKIIITDHSEYTWTIPEIIITDHSDIGNLPETNVKDHSDDEDLDNLPDAKQQDIASIPDRTQDTASIPDKAQDTASIPDKAQDTASIPDKAQDIASIPNKTQDTTSIPDTTQDTTSIPDRTQDTTSIPDKTHDNASLQDTPTTGVQEVTDDTQTSENINSSAGHDGDASKARHHVSSHKSFESVKDQVSIQESVQHVRSKQDTMTSVSVSDQQEEIIQGVVDHLSHGTELGIEAVEVVKSDGLSIDSQPSETCSSIIFPDGKSVPPAEFTTMQKQIRQVDEITAEDGTQNAMNEVEMEKESDTVPSGGYIYSSNQNTNPHETVINGDIQKAFLPEKPVVSQTWIEPDLVTQAMHIVKDVVQKALVVYRSMASASEDVNLNINNQNEKGVIKEQNYVLSENDNTVDLNLADIIPENRLGHSGEEDSMLAESLDQKLGSFVDQPDNWAFSDTDMLDSGIGSFLVSQVDIPDDIPLDNSHDNQREILQNESSVEIPPSCSYQDPLEISTVPVPTPYTGVISIEECEPMIADSVENNVEHLIRDESVEDKSIVRGIEEDIKLVHPTESQKDAPISKLQSEDAANDKSASDSREVLAKQIVHSVIEKASSIHLKYLESVHLQKMEFDTPLKNQESSEFQVPALQIQESSEFQDVKNQESSEFDNAHLENEESSDDTVSVQTVSVDFDVEGHLHNTATDEDLVSTPEYPILSADDEQDQAEADVSDNISAAIKQPQVRKRKLHRKRCLSASAEFLPQSTLSSDENIDRYFRSQSMEVLNRRESLEEFVISMKKAWELSDDDSSEDGYVEISAARLSTKMKRAEQDGDLDATTPVTEQPQPALVPFCNEIPTGSSISQSTDDETLDRLLHPMILCNENLEDTYIPSKRIIEKGASRVEKVVMDGKRLHSTKLISGGLQMFGHSPGNPYLVETSAEKLKRATMDKDYDSVSTVSSLSSHTSGNSRRKTKSGGSTASGSIDVVMDHVPQRTEKDIPTFYSLESPSTVLSIKKLRDPFYEQTEQSTESASSSKKKLRHSENRVASFMSPSPWGHLRRSTSLMSDDRQPLGSKTKRKSRSAAHRRLQFQEERTHSDTSAATVPQTPVRSRSYESLRQPSSSYNDL